MMDDPVRLRVGLLYTNYCINVFMKILYPNIFVKIMTGNGRVG